MNEFEEALGLSFADGCYETAPEAIGELLGFVIEALPGDLDAILADISESNGDPKSWRLVAEAVLSPSNEAQRLLRKLAEHTIKHHRDIDPVDFTNIHNWGFAVRKGKVVPIVLDAGFSPEVRDKWY